MKRLLLLLLYIVALIPCTAQSNDKLPQLEVQQRKGNMLIKLHNYNDTTSLVCVIQGSGNNLEADYDPRSHGDSPPVRSTWIKLFSKK